MWRRKVRPQLLRTTAKAYCPEPWIWRRLPTIISLTSHQTVRRTNRREVERKIELYQIQPVYQNGCILTTVVCVKIDTSLPCPDATRFSSSTDAFMSLARFSGVILKAGPRLVSHTSSFIPLNSSIFRLSTRSRNCISKTAALQALKDTRHF